MGSVSEIEVIKIIDDALSQTEDEQTKSRILNWAWSKYLSKK